MTNQTVLIVSIRSNRLLSLQAVHMKHTDGFVCHVTEEQ